jgi:nucleotide-binding universal stress UspA family protein
MTATETVAAERFADSSAPAQDRPTIIVATDGSDGSNAAFTAALLMGEMQDLQVRVVSVLEPMAIPARIPQELLESVEVDTLRARELGNRVRAQIKAAGTKAANWPAETRTGVPAQLIGQIAQEQDASLIITGPSKHGLLERLVGGETAARVAQLARIPLLAVSPDMHRLPERVVIAMDLDPLHLGELSRVLRMFGPAASVTCVHVKPREDFPGSESPAFARAYETAVAQSFEATENAISKVPGLRADLVRLSGDPAEELLRYAHYAKAELLVLGLRRHYGLRRLLGGGVALKVLRGANCSVLVVPERVSPAARNGVSDKEKRPTTLTSYDAAMWPSQLKQFTQRNAGRHATLEVDGAAVGAMLQVVELPFIGADYDHRDGRVEILLGDFTGSDRHFSRSISNPDSISVLKASDARDSVLCVSYEGGQTLLTFK